MASEAPANGTSSASAAAAADGMSAAEKMMQQHAAHEPHNPTVQEVPDEDIIAHPPPTGVPTLSSPAAPEPEQQQQQQQPTYAKAEGKKPMRENAPEQQQQQQQTPKKPALDTQSEDAFPALGGPKAASTAAAPSMWSRKPAAVGKAVNGTANGLVNGTAPSTVTSSSRTSTPAGSGIVTPSTGKTVAPQRGSAPQMSIPGRYSEQVKLYPSQMIPRSQLKKPVTDILRDISKRSKANVEMKSGAGGMVIFEGTGPVDAVHVALKEVASQLCPKQNISVPIPSSIRGKIVGKQGATIQAISKKTGARINISKQEAATILEDDDADSTIDVTIEGDPFAVQLAKQDIEKIVNEHTSSVNTRLKHIPAEYYPFLAGPHGQRSKALQEGRDFKMQIPTYHTWRDQAPPQSTGRPASFTPQANLPIVLSGDRQAVADARAELDNLVAELEKQLTLEQTTIERARHQFIVGELGSSLHDFLQETGCTVVMPPAHDDSETLTIIGPPERIEEGLNKVMDLASSMSMTNADVAKQHANAPRGAQTHARDITRYLQQRQAIAELERTHDARIVPDSNGAWQIYARDGRTAMKARSDVMNLISGHPPNRFHPLAVDRFYHSHIREQMAPRIREQHGVRVVVPEEGDDSPLLLVFEDRAPSPEYQLPRRQPSAEDAAAFQAALQQAQQEILSVLTGRDEIVTREVDAPVKFHDKIRRHADRHHQSLPQGSIPLQMIYGGSSSSSQQRASQNKARAAPGITMRGPGPDVDAFMQNLLAFIEQEEKDELERGFTLSFDFPQKFAQHLIGRRGENINRLREEFDVDIQLQEGKCEIKGPEAKANACKKHILDMAKKLEDEAEHHLHIPQQYHRDLIGPQGSQVNRLQDRYNVRVNFPRSRQQQQQGADDAASEVAESNAGRRNNRDNQQPNEVIVKGPSKGADACRDELLSLLQYVKDNSHSATVSVAQSQLPSLIGSGGKEMESLRLATGAQIDVPNAKEASGADGRAEIKIKGSKKAVEDAKKLIEEKAKVFDDTITRHLEVDRKLHRIIIGAQGANLRGIITQAGGPDDVRMHNRMIRFPKAEADGNTIRVEGQTSVVDKICAAIEALVAEQESQTSDVVEVKPDKHRLLIGRGGETRRQLEQQFGVTINVPRQSETGPARSQVRLAGQPEKVEQAKAHILELTKDQAGETVSVPKRLHHAIADNGQFFRRLRSDHRVTVDHAGQRPPPRPSAPTPSRANGGAAMPLITDDASAGSETHHWETHPLNDSSSTVEGEIPWVLTGPSPEAITAARARLDTAVTEASLQDTVGFLILPDPRAYRLVIGPGGSEINRIRSQTATRIQVPRDQSRGEAIEILGAAAGVEEAKEIILGIVSGGGA